ncbi:hypothetical protein [Gimesia sp.]|uniref:hypothetical protein n=1 Tax=Gimesia sp. TaxID=2024833 RepID=UPI0032EEA56C
MIRGAWLIWRGSETYQPLNCESPQPQRRETWHIVEFGFSPGDRLSAPAEQQLRLEAVEFVQQVPCSISETVRLLLTQQQREFDF